MVTVKELEEELKQSAEVLGSSFGGFTFSGGEPLMQSKFLFKVAEELKGYNLCIETSGYADSNTFKEAIEKFDFIIMDIKIADGKKHKEYTGVGNEQILKNFAILKNSNKPYLIRTPLIPGITDTRENMDEISKIIGDSKWEKLTYNQIAGAKYKMLGMKFPL